MSEKKNIYQRLHAVMGDVDYVQKEKKNGMNYSIVSHDAVTAKVRPALHKHGIVYHPSNLRRLQDGNRTEIEIDVTFVNIDDPNDKITVPSLGYGIDGQDKGPGKAISYAVKYALLKALGLETGDDADLDSQDHEPKKKFTREDKMLERDLGYELSLCKTVKDVEDFLSDNKTLPDNLKDSAESKKIGLSNNVAFPPAKYGFIDVQEALAFGTLAKKNIEEGPIEGLENWLLENHHKIKALDSILTAKMYNKDGTPSERLYRSYDIRFNQQAAE